MEVTDVQYKESEIGVLPLDWEVKTLGDVGEVKMCRRVFNQETKLEGVIPFYKIGTFGKEADAYISQELYDNYRQRFSFPKTGDVLISAAGTIGRTMVYDGEPAYYQDSNIVWIDNKEGLVLNKYLYYVLQVAKYNTEGGTIQRLYNSILKNTKFICPAKSEQTAIATALSDTDALIENLEKLIAKKRNIKQGVMQELLKPESNWILTSVGEVATIRKGEQLNKDTLTAQGQYPVMNGGIQPSGYTDKWNQNPNTIIISEGGNSCGYVNFIKTRFWQGGHCYSVDAKIHKHFLYHLLKFHEKEIMGLRVGSGLPNIQRNRLIEFSLSIPDREKQHAIALVLDEINEVITAMENKLQKYKMVKQGMMQALLTGKIRLA